MSRVIVTGVTTGIQSQNASQLPQRLEWHDFVQNLEFVTLYVNALGQLMKADQSQTTSYFQIAGLPTGFSMLSLRHSRVALYSLERC